MAEKIRVMIPEEEVDAKIKELGQKISEKFAGEEVHLICILKGSVFFVCELAKRITVPVTIDFMQVSSYGAETKSSGVVRLSKDLDEPLQGKNVIIAAHGNSLRALTKYIENISDDDIMNLEMKTGEPVVYTFDENLDVVNKEKLDD